MTKLPKPLTIAVLSLFCLVTLRSILEASDQKHAENYWQTIKSKQSAVETEITTDGGAAYCMTFEPDLMRQLASLKLQNGDTVESAAIYSDFWTADTKNSGNGFNSRFIDDALSLASVYQAQGAQMHSLDCYKSVFDYDMRRHKMSDPVMSRDFNNLGVSYYLAANTKTNTKEREELFDASQKMYKAALANADVKQSPFLVSTIKHNLTFTNRDYTPRQKP